MLFVMEQKSEFTFLNPICRCRCADGANQSAFDLVVSNPPYIPRRDANTLAREVRDHEPAVALYGGEEGYELYAGLIALARRYLKPGGIFVAELGHDSLPAVQPLLDAASVDGRGRK